MCNLRLAQHMELGGESRLRRISISHLTSVLEGKDQVERTFDQGLGPTSADPTHPVIGGL